METVNQENTGIAPEKTFTQSELDAIVSDRLQRERNKYADYSALKEKAEKFDQYTEQNKSELQKATDKVAELQKELSTIKSEAAIRSIRDKVAKDTGVPVELLTASTEEECVAQAEAIKAFAKPGYPNVKDAGEPGGTQKRSTSQQFVEWFNGQF